MFWHLVRIVDAGKILDLAFVNELIQAFHIALAADFEGTSDVYLDKVPNFFARPLACLAVRGNSGRDGNHAIAGQQATDESDALDIGIAVLAAKTQTFAQVCAHDIAIQHLNITLTHFQAALNGPGKGTFTSARETGKPDSKAYAGHVH